MLKLISDEEILKRYPMRGKIEVQGHTINIPAVYKGEGLTAVFPISYNKAVKMISSSDLKPARLSFTKALLSVTAFNFLESPIGPYTELVYSIPVFYKPKFNFPLIPLLFNKFSKKFGFYVLDILQSTKIAVAHGNLLTGYPHNENLIKIEFTHKGIDLVVKAYDNTKEILTFCGIKKKGRGHIKDFYMTYFEKEKRLSKIQMDIHGVENKFSKCSFIAGNSKLASIFYMLGASSKPLQVRYYPYVIEVNPVSCESL
jgi:hypothetical protein